MEPNKEMTRIVRIPLPIYGPVSVRITDDMLELNVMDLLEAIAIHFVKNGETDKARSARSLKEKKIVINGTEMNPFQMRVKDLEFVVNEMGLGKQIITDEYLAHDDCDDRRNDVTIVERKRTQPASMFDLNPLLPEPSFVVNADGKPVERASGEDPADSELMKNAAAAAAEHAERYPPKDWNKIARLVIDALWNVNIIPDEAHDNAMDDMINIVVPVLKKELDG
jgi:hypothetical protein